MGHPTPPARARSSSTHVYSKKPYTRGFVDCPARQLVLEAGGPQTPMCKHAVHGVINVKTCNSHCKRDPYTTYIPYSGAADCRNHVVSHQLECLYAIPFVNNRQALKNSDVTASTVAEHVLEAGHQVDLPKAAIIDCHPHTQTRCLLES